GNVTKTLVNVSIGIALACSACGSSSAPMTSMNGGVSGNLIVNGDAEAAPGSADGQPVATPGWTSAGEATAIQYGAPGGLPKLSDFGPTNRGSSFLAGGPNEATSSLSQSIDVSRYAAAIDRG